MFFALPVLLAALLGRGAAETPWVGHDPGDRRQVAAADPASTIRDEITRLEDALRVEYSQLASLCNTNPSACAPYSTSTNTRRSSIPSVSSRSSAASISSANSLTASSSAATSTPASKSSSLRSTAVTISVAPNTSFPLSVSRFSTVSTSSSTTSSRTSTTTSSGSPPPPSTAAPSAKANSTTSTTTSSMGGIISTPSPPAPPAPGTPDPMASVSCETLCSSLTFPTGFDASPVSCVSYAANSTITITGGQAESTCGTSFVPEVDVCRVVLTVATSEESEVYMEVWLPEGESEWNGRTMSTDNGGVNGCVKFVDMQYVTSLGFAAIGDNAGHNGSSFDGSWFAESNELILDWAYRARHSSVVVGKAVVNQFYNTPAEYSYYIGCSAGGAQGMKSAQEYPDDFDGIISGSAASDFNHLQAWSGRFLQLTGSPTAETFLTSADWLTVQTAIFDQCDAAIDGVDDGILEDPTACQFDSSVLACSNNATLAGCLTDIQVTTVNNVFSELYNTEGELLYPALQYGSQVDAFRLGQLSGAAQGISRDWYKFAVVDDPDWEAVDMSQADYARADELDAFHGGVSAYSGDLSAFQASGGKLLMYHGMADPLVTQGNSQRYYLKVAQSLGLDNSGLDDFFRLFRISGMAHCGVGGISGAGAWMFGQNRVASVAPNSIISDLQDWVEDDVAPDTLTGTKFWYDTPSLGVQFTRAHCRFPYRTTYRGNGLDSTLASSWSCELIEDWQECGVGASPRLCNVDGSFL